MSKQTAVDKAIATLEAEKAAIEYAIQKLRATQVAKTVAKMRAPRALKDASA